MPACNIMLLGAQRKTLSGFSSTSVLPHTGYIYHSDIVQSLPPVSPHLAPAPSKLGTCEPWTGTALQPDPRRAGQAFLTKPVAQCT